MASQPGPWPDEAQLQLLRAALLDGDAAREAWAGWRARGLEIEHLDPGSYRLLPQLYRNLSKLEIEDPALPQLKGIYRHAWYMNQRLLHDGSLALALLREAGIQVMVLKGTALIALYHQDVGLRPMADIDVLVPAEETETALAKLKAVGWRLDQAKVGDRPVRELMRVRHAAPLIGPRGQALDLHWSALASAGGITGLWDSAQPVVLRDVPVSVPGTVDLLLLACAHGLGWTTTQVQWIVDAVLIEGASEDGIRWDQLARRAKAWDQALTLADALTLLRHTFEVQVPDAVLQELRDAPATPLQRLAHRVKIGPRRAGRLSQAVRILLWRWDAARRVAAAPYSAQGGPGGLFSFLREYWGLPNRRATVGHAAGAAIRLATGSIASRPGPGTGPPA